MSKDEFIEMYDIQDGTIILEPWEEYSPGIVGVVDGCHIVYDYDRLVESLADSFAKDGDDDEDYVTQAIEWIDYNTMRSIAYMDQEFRPYIMQAVEEE